MIITTSDFDKHFRKSIYKEKFYIDEDFDFNIGRDIIIISQGGNIYEIGAKENILFSPFFMPFENASIPWKLYSLLLALENLVPNITPSPIKWLLAYDKTFLIKCSALQTFLSNGFHLHNYDDAFIIKSGFGINWPIEGEHIHASVFGNIDIEKIPEYKYCFQKYIQPDKEFRIYSFLGGDMRRIISLEMPTGTRDNVDWRDELEINSLKIAETDNPICKRIAAEIHEISKLPYICLDILASENDLKIVDINPHGSWYWLPDEFAIEIEDAYTSFFLEESTDGR